MNNEELQADLDRIVATIGKPLKVIYSILFTIGISSLLWNMYSGISTPLFVIVFYSLAILIQFLEIFIVKRCKEVVLGAYGFRCQSCSKTPIPRYFDTSHKNIFCPHCQLKYWPDPDRDGIA
jgi:hypothetical protein